MFRAARNSWQTIGIDSRYQDLGLRWVREGRVVSNYADFVHGNGGPDSHRCHVRLFSDAKSVRYRTLALDEVITAGVARVLLREICARTRSVTLMVAQGYWPAGVPVPSLEIAKA